MGLNFSEVSRTQSKTLGSVNPDHEAGFSEAVEYFTDEANSKKDLSVDFPSVEERDAFVKYCRAASEGAGMRFRAIVCEKGAARLVFRMENEAAYLIRKAKRDAAAKDLADRKARGEVITRGRKPQAAA